MLQLFCHTHTHTHHSNGHFPGEPGSAGSSKFSAGGMPFLSPNQQLQSSEGLTDISFYRRQDTGPAAQPTVSTHWKQSFMLPNQTKTRRSASTEKQHISYTV